jgi:PAS domain S-box-containing protein
VKQRGRRKEKNQQILFEGNVKFLRDLTLSPHDHPDLLQEIMKHHAELEIQNEELRNMQVELEESRNKFCDLYDFSPISFFSVNKSGLITEVNMSGAKLLGIDRFRLLKKSFGGFVHPDERPRYYAHLQSSLTREISISDEFRLIRKDGTIKWVYVESIAHEDPDGIVSSIRSAVLDISSLKEEQEKRLHAEERFRILSENAPDLICWFDKDLRYTYVNPLMEKSLGLPFDAITGKTCEELGMHRDLSETWTETLLFVFQTGQTSAAELDFPTPEGNRTYHMRAFPELDKQGNVSRVMTIARDITSRKKMELELRDANLALEKRVQERTAQLEEMNMELIREIRQRMNMEKELRKQTEMLQAIIDNIPVMLFIYKPDGKVQLINRTIETLTGWSLDEVRKQRILEKVFPERCRPGTDGILKETTPAWCDLHLRTKNGNHLHSAWSVVKLSSGDQIGIGIDLSRHISAEQERIKLAAAMEQSSDALAIAGSDGTIQYVNIAFENINLCSRSEVLGRSVIQILTESGVLSRPGKRKDIEYAFSSGKLWKGRLRKTGKQESELELTVSPFKDPFGHIINYLVSIRDITNEVNLERHLRASQKLEVIGALTGGIAHDMNNILTPMILNTEMALSDLPEESSVRSLLETVLEAEMRGKDLVRQILTFSSHKKEDRKPIRLSVLIHESLKLLRVSVPPTITVKIDIMDESLTLLGDPSQINQVIMNLCNNAVHAMKETGGVLGISSEGKEIDPIMVTHYPDLKPGHYLCLTVTDTGRGMTENSLERIFDPFFTTKSPKEGTGMGLTVAQRIVRSHGGTIIASSQYGYGTTFKVFLPRIQAELEQEAASFRVVPRGRERILFIDDETIQVRSAHGVLKYLGYQVTAQEDSREALKVFKSRPDTFDLVITDLVMPGMDGMELAQEVLKIRPDIPVILCTGFSDTVNEQQAYKSGISEFMMKPFSLGELATTIRRSLKAPVNLQLNEKTRVGG